jgi:hypothetical protein
MDVAIEVEQAPEQISRVTTACKQFEFLKRLDKRCSYQMRRDDLGRAAQLAL